MGVKLALATKTAVAGIITARSTRAGLHALPKACNAQNKRRQFSGSNSRNGRLPRLGFAGASPGEDGKRLFPFWVKAARRASTPRGPDPAVFYHLAGDMQPIMGPNCFVSSPRPARGQTLTVFTKTGRRPFPGAGWKRPGSLLVW